MRHRRDFLRTSATAAGRIADVVNHREAESMNCLRVLAAHACWSRHSWLLLTVMFLLTGATAVAADAPAPRRVISLDGIWQIEQGKLESIPKVFAHTAVAPGLVDMAKPAFAEVGVKSPLREAFWYRRTFTLAGPVPSVATLKVHKACYGTRVYLNGAFVGEHLPCFTPGLFNVRDRLRGEGKENGLIICVGTRESLPKHIYPGADGERNKCISGIYDSVELILSGTPHIESVQAVPELDAKTVRVVATLSNAGTACAVRVKYRVTEAVSGKPVGSVESAAVEIAPSEQKTVEARVPIAGCRLWSPDDPFLYRLEVDTGADRHTVRFGMRTFGFDPKTKLPTLNGKTCYLRGTNVCIFRFFEDSDRGDRPWREEWIRRLHKAFRGMHFNAARYCIGFPPEKWYDVADETGLMIQNEFPIWYGDAWPKELTSGELTNEFREWMRESWNHPSIVIWDAQNEIHSELTSEAIRAVRNLDLSDRPWDNGQSSLQRPTDTYEIHPYVFNASPFSASPPHTKASSFRLSEFAHLPGVPSGDPPNVGHNPVIINEYDWLWLTRDGQPTMLTKENYEALLGPGATVEQRRELYARYMAAITEFWRCHRQVAGLLYFCGLGYSRCDGYTSDNFIDIERCAFEPHWARYVRDAFAPVGLMIDAWAERYAPGPGRNFPVVVINDRHEIWRGTVRFRLLCDGRTLAEQTQPCEVPAVGRQTLAFAIDIPNRSAQYQVEAALLRPGDETVRSLRDFAVLAGPNPNRPASSR
jgi:hypothetical protein